MLATDRMSTSTIQSQRPPLRIAVVISSMRPGGAERITSILTREWAARGHAVTLLTVQPGESFYPLAPAVAHRSLGVDRGQGRGAGVRHNVERLAAVRAGLTETRPDVVLSLITVTNVVTLAATLGTSLPVVAAVCAYPGIPMLGRHWQIASRLLYHRAARVIVETEQARDFYPRSLRRRTAIIPSPVERRDAPAGGPVFERPTVIGLGSLAAHKRFELLVEAFARCAADHPDWQLCIVGDGPDRATVERRAADLGIADRVALPGHTKSPEAYLRAARIFAMTSRTEGFPNAMVEAMACGLPALSFDCPAGPRAIIRHGVDGLLVPNDDVPALARALSSLMGDEARRARLAERAPDVLERFSVERVVGLWEDVFYASVRGDERR